MAVVLLKPNADVDGEPGKDGSGHIQYVGSEGGRSLIN